MSNYTQACVRVVTAFGNYLASCTPMHTRAYTCALYAPRVTRASDNLEACISDKQGTRMYFLLPPVSRYPATRIIQRPRPFPVPVLLFLRKFPSFLLFPFPSAYNSPLHRSILRNYVRNRGGGCNFKFSPFDGAIA